MTTRTNRLGALAIAAALAASLLALAALTKPAEAAFPGNNCKIVFASDRYTFFNPEGDLEIYTMNPNGTGVVQLTVNTADDRYPAYAPDGKKIAFVKNSNNDAEVYTMNANGSGQINR